VSKHLLREISENIVKGDSIRTKQLVEQALEEFTPEVVIKEGLIPGMETVSARFQSCEFCLVDVVVAADAMQKGVQILKEKCRKEKAFAPKGRVVIGTVEGDIHDLGKNIVAVTLEGAGYEVVDLGVDVSPTQFVKAIAKFQPDLVCISALLTVTMLRMEDVIEAIKEAGLREQVKIIVGGAPVTQSFADKIGADAYVEYGTNVVYKADELLKKKGRRVALIQLPSILKEKHQEIFRKLFDFTPTFLDQNNRVILQGEELPECCRECREWNYEHNAEKTVVYSCPGGLSIIEARIEGDSIKLGKIICGPFLVETPGKVCVCAPGAKKVSSLELEKIAIFTQMIAEQIQIESREKLLQVQLEDQREILIRALKFQEELKNALNEARYRSLQSQVNPHFLFNSLNSLARLAMLEEAEKTEKFAYALSRILRYILRNIKSTVRIAEEIEIIRDYLFIQQVRFTDRLSVHLRIDEHIYDGLMPCMVLQPLVENAVVHGLEPLEREGMLEVSGERKGELVFFEIKDNGVGMSSDKLREISQLKISRSGRGHTTGLGLFNVHQRLQHYFGSNSGLEIQSQQNKGTSVKVFFPYIPQ